MALINRFSRLFTADLHAVMDRMEEPEALLKQAVREMGEQLAEMQLKAQQYAFDVENLTTREHEMKTCLKQIEDELDVCFASGEERLAKTLIKRRLEVERRAKAITAKIAEISKTLSRLETDIVENQRHLDGLQQKLELAANIAPRGTPIDLSNCDYGVSNEDIEIAFLREIQRRARP